MYHRRVLPSVGISDELRENFLEKIRHGHFHFSSADPQSVAFLEKYAEPVAVFDRDLKHVLVNSAVALATDIPAQQFRGKTLREMGHREDICEQIELNVKTVFMTGDERTTILIYDGPNGSITYDCRLVPQFSGNRVECVVLMAHDISDED